MFLSYFYWKKNKDKPSNPLFIKVFRFVFIILYGHSCASLLLRNGVSMKQIQAWLGHSDYGTTANLYAHLDMEASLITSAEQLNNGLFGSNLTQFK
ncbi:tyrosine-type recombinase/integrase [Anaerotignum sp.]|uniref:tyrosine-type recombinase/integrase n=1 Tax=Anaerotignum sp. TaxID=2039241 RepID=UPI002ED2E93C